MKSFCLSFLQETFHLAPETIARAGKDEADRLQLLKIAGELYLPFLVANAEAFAKGLERLEMNVWGLPYTLAPFKY